MHAAARVGGFDATGSGTVVTRGNLTVFGNITGTFVVRDPVGGATVKLNGVRQQPAIIVADGREVRVYRLRKVQDASFYAKGRNIRVELRSTPDTTLSMTALGRGTVQRLEGTGTYHLNGGTEEQWPPVASPIEIRPPKPSRVAAPATTVTPPA